VGGWEDIADYALTWCEEQIGKRAEGKTESESVTRG
jgi:hypothetical protein